MPINPSIPLSGTPQDAGGRASRFLNLAQGVQRLKAGEQEMELQRRNIAALAADRDATALRTRLETQKAQQAQHEEETYRQAVTQNYDPDKHDYNDTGIVDALVKAGLPDRAMKYAADARTNREGIRKEQDAIKKEEDEKHISFANASQAVTSAATPEAAQAAWANLTESFKDKLDKSDAQVVGQLGPQYTPQVAQFLKAAQDAAIPILDQRKLDEPKVVGKSLVKTGPDGKATALYTEPTPVAPEKTADRRVRIVEEAYAQRELHKDPAALTSFDRVKAAEWGAKMSPEKQTEIDKRVALYDKDPEKYNAIFGRGGEVSAAARVGLVRGIFSDLRAINKDERQTPEEDKKYYEDQRSIYKSMGVDIPAYDEAQRKADAAAAPAKGKTTTRAEVEAAVKRANDKGAKTTYDEAVKKIEAAGGKVLP